MSPDRAVPAGQRCWDAMPGHCWHHPRTTGRATRFCCRCLSEDYIDEQPTTLARLEAAGTTMTWPDVALAYERGAKP